MTSQAPFLGRIAAPCADVGSPPDVGIRAETIAEEKA